MTAWPSPAIAPVAPNEILAELAKVPALQALFDDRIRGTSARGIDRVNPDQFSYDLAKSLPVVTDKLLAGTYRFAPYLESLRLKAHDKPPRVISIPTVRDRVVLLVLKELLHRVFPECVARRLPNEYVRSIIASYDAGFRGSYVKADIRAFFDSIDQARLVAILASRLPSPILRLLEKAIRNPTLPTHYAGRPPRLRPLAKGVPQGLAVSNILAEIYMHKSDGEIEARVEQYLRYVDDIVLLVSPDQEDVSYEALGDHLARIDLQLAQDKHRQGSIEKPFEYLGYEMGLPRVSVRPATVSRFVDSLAGQFKQFALRTDPRYRAEWLDDAGRVAVFLDDLNERLTGAVSQNRRYGWLFYFLEINDHSLLHSIDHIVRGLWARYMTGPHPRGLKRLARAHYEARFNQLGTYIHNYNQYRTLASKLELLVRRGVLDPASQARHTRAQVEEMFAEFRSRNLARLEADVGGHFLSE